VPLKPCLTCGRLSRRSYCPGHLPVGWYDRPSPSSRDRLAPNVRQQVKAAAGHHCNRCGTTGSPENRLVVHHVRRVADGGAHERTNLEVICEQCSQAEHGKDNRR
jgi:5-methylcytosine-specific restriction endonuclease McrA